MSYPLRVVAIEHEIFPDGSDVFPRIAAANGGVIPATEFLVHDLDPYDLLKAVRIPLTCGFATHPSDRAIRGPVW